ncbi:MAG: hypothetical protein ACFFAH_09940 [Promethearchaeota archaeon]
MPRKPRSAPERGADPLDMYSTWDVRIARLFYYSFVAATIIVMLGTYVTILIGIPQGVWEWYVSLEIAYQIAIVGAIITAHLLVIVFFYAAFRGGIYRMCRVLYKNRIIAKKYEDKSLLRWLVGVLLLGIYFTIFAIVIGLLSTEFVRDIEELWLWMVKNFNLGHWILWIGIVVLCVSLFFFFMFVIWNHIVYLFLKITVRVEEEEEVSAEIKKEKIQKMSEEERQKEYTKNTGRAAVIRGRETGAYKRWKKKMGVK